MEDYVRLELDAAQKGWRCSGCGLLSDVLGRPIFGGEAWTIQTKSINWLENRPKYKFCPKCGKPVREGYRNG